MFAGEPDTHNEIVKSRGSTPHTMDESKPADTISTSPVFNPQDLIGRSFLMGTCAIYARENGLLDKPGWKRF
jgi:hypothetical protein